MTAVWKIQAQMVADIAALYGKSATLGREQMLYITKLDKGAEEEGLYGAKELYKKAVLRFYKLRCSIAHAGTSGVIYEQFPDANAAALSLLPSIEAIALKSLKIETIT